MTVHDLPTAPAMTDSDLEFDSMGSEARILVGAPMTPGEVPPARAAALVRDFLAAYEARLSRFRPDSELCALNADPAAEVTASRLLRIAVRAGRWAAERTGGLVDPTLVSELEAAGYAASRRVPELGLEEALAAAPPRRPARPAAAHGWQALAVDDALGTIRRPPGLRFDTGGTGKGLAADLAAARLGGYARWAVDCGGDLRVSAPTAEPFDIEIEHPLTGERIHVLRLATGAVATSGLNVRMWRRADGTPAHHLLDPATGDPAWTGVVGATALAPTALEAETLAKAALLSRPARGTPLAGAPRWAARPRRRRRRALRAAAGAPRGSTEASGMTDTALHHGWWLASRAAGVVALLLVSASVPIGLTMASGVLRKPGLKRSLLAFHEHTALAGLVSIGVHGVTLLGDAWLRPGLAGIAIPFVIGYRTVYVGLGILAGYLAALLGLSFYARRRIGARLWRRLHKATVLVYVLGARPHTRRRDRRGHDLAARRDARDRRAHRDPLRAAGRSKPPRAGPRSAPAGRAAPCSPSGPRGEPLMRVLIAGGGLAAQRCAETLRARGHDGPVTMLVRRAARALRSPAAVKGRAGRRRPSRLPAAGLVRRARDRVATRQPGAAARPRRACRHGRR